MVHLVLDPEPSATSRSDDRGMSLPDLPFFLVSDALEQGASRSMLRSSTLDAPFHGVRAHAGALFDVDRVCAAYALKMPTSSAFTSVTAARLWRIPLPAYVENGLRVVDVAALAPRRAPRGANIRGSKYSSGVARRVVVHGLPVLSAIDTWCSLTSVLDIADLAAVADHLLSDGPGVRLAHAILDELQVAVDRRAGHRGSRALQDALALARPHCWSRTETLARVALTTAGIPEPVLNHPLAVGRRLVRLDLAWPDARFGLEYDGDQHRDPRHFADDIARQELIQDVQWSLMRMTRIDLFDHPETFVRRVASRLSERGVSSIRVDVSHMVRSRR